MSDSFFEKSSSTSRISPRLTLDSLIARVSKAIDSDNETCTVFAVESDRSTDSEICIIVSFDVSSFKVRDSVIDTPFDRDSSDESDRDIVSSIGMVTLFDD